MGIKRVVAGIATGGLTEVGRAVAGGFGAKDAARKEAESAQRAFEEEERKKRAAEELRRKNAVTFDSFNVTGGKLNQSGGSSSRNTLLGN